MLVHSARCSLLSIPLDRTGLTRGRGGGTLDWGNEPITAPRDRLDIKRPLRIVMKNGADLLDAEIHTLIEIDVCVGPPELLPDFFAGHQLSGARNQQDKQPKWLR